MKTSRPFIIFYLLVGYIFIQFSWWGYHLIDLNQEIYELKIAWATEMGEESALVDLTTKLEGAKLW